MVGDERDVPADASRLRLIDAFSSSDRDSAVLDEIRMSNEDKLRWSTDLGWQVTSPVEHSPSQPAPSTSSYGLATDAPDDARDE